MALADILSRIDCDAEAEANGLIVAAEEEAERVRSQAQSQGTARRAAAVEHAKDEATDDAQTRLAAARLRGRDQMLAKKRAVIDRVLEQVVGRIEQLPDERYAALIAQGVAQVVRSSEAIACGSDDADRLGRHLPDALKALGVSVESIKTTTAIRRGVIVEGERMHVEISPHTMIDAQHDELVVVVSRALFENGEG